MSRPKILIANFSTSSKARGWIHWPAALGGTSFADFDNDGDLDLLVGISNQINHFFLNDGSGFFSDATGQSGLDDRSPYVAVGDYDYDDDGFLDLLYSLSGTRSITAFFRNNGNKNHWLRVKLVGIESNRDGIGARIIATSGDLTQVRELLGGVGRQQDERVAHFGLAQRTKADRIEIRWPSGQVDLLENITADQKIRVFEGRAGYQVVRPTVWDSAPPMAVIEDAPATFELRVRPQLFEPNAEITRITADLSAFDAEETESLEAARDGTYRLAATPVVSGARGPREVSVTVEQATSLGPYWTRLVRAVIVAPAIDLPVFRDSGGPSWRASSRWFDNLTHDPSWDYAPAWSPDGTRILFSRFRNRNAMDIYQVRPDGSDLSMLTNSPFWDWLPSWSPDGTKIVFITNRDGNSDLYVMGADGSNQVPLINQPEDDGAGTFSPDGSKIVFDPIRDGNREIYVMNADGSNPVNLTNHPAHDAAPSWSPDGTKILFHSNRDGNSEIYLMDADGSNPVNLTNHPGGDSVPDFSPVGSRIAFESDRDGDTDIYLMNSDGSDPVNLTSYALLDLVPHWSPDGRHIAFARGRGRPEIYITEVVPSDRLVLHPDQQQVVFEGRMRCRFRPGTANGKSLRTAGARRPRGLRDIALCLPSR